MTWLKRIACFFFGHPCVPTGRRGLVLTEHCCIRCDGIYVSHRDHGNALLPANEESDRIFADEERWLRG